MKDENKFFERSTLQKWWHWQNLFVLMIEIIHFLAFIENIYQVKNYIDRISIVTISKSIYLEKIDR